MRCSTLLSFVLCAVGALGYDTSLSKRAHDGFVTVENGELVKDGKPFGFLATNAYWIPALESDEAIQTALESIAQSGIKVLRTWAFNDVDEIPDSGVWFQLIKDGKATINDGPDGLQRLDKVVQFAEKAGLHVLFSLTNNWNPRPDLDDHDSNGHQRRWNPDRPRAYLSNDYGGMDVYVRNICEKKHHDEFYTNEKIIKVFEEYTTAVVKRFVDNPTVLGWELANDARCSSTLPASPECNTHKITQWHAEVAKHIRSVDPNHLIASGTHGFLCKDCPKLFPLPEKPNDHHRREFEGVTIRGREIGSAIPPRSEDAAADAAFDGSFGVDSQDILSIPDIDFGSYQLFPDQNVYGKTDPNLSFVDNAVKQGSEWIELQGKLEKLVCKPNILIAFGLLTQDNAPSFVPFDSTVAPFAEEDDNTWGHTRAPTRAAAASNAQQNSAYRAWLGSGSGSRSSAQYQWGQGGGSAGSSYTPNTGRTGISGRSCDGPFSPCESPNDGYRLAPDGSDGILATLTEFAQQFEH